MATKRSHKNTPRMTARERAEDVLRQLGWAGKSRSYTVLRELLIIERGLQAHARAALDRAKRRAR